MRLARALSEVRRIPARVTVFSFVGSIGIGLLVCFVSPSVVAGRERRRPVGLYFESVYWIKALGRIPAVWQGVPRFEPAATSGCGDFAAIIRTALVVNSGSRSAIGVTAAVLRSNFAERRSWIVVSGTDDGQPVSLLGRLLSPLRGFLAKFDGDFRVYCHLVRSLMSL